MVCAEGSRQLSLCLVRRYYTQPMKRLLILVLFGSVAGAAEIVEWPPDTSKGWRTVSVSKLPAGVRPEDPEDSERPLTAVRVRKLGGDGDGVPDFIVDTGRGGSGGSDVTVYRREGKRYREVLTEQGGIVVLPADGGTARVACWGRIGGGEYRRTIYRFSRGRFIEEFMQTLRHREDDKLEVTDTQEVSDRDCYR